MALLDAGNTEQASTKLKEAVVIDPANADIHYQLGRVLSKLGERDQARQHFLLFCKLEKK
jgi:Flp pilus assembly protein TadD